MKLISAVFVKIKKLITSAFSRKIMVSHIDRLTVPVFKDIVKKKLNRDQKVKRK